jgi:hypothetical protein
MNAIEHHDHACEATVRAANESLLCDGEELQATIEREALVVAGLVEEEPPFDASW